MSSSPDQSQRRSEGLTPADERVLDALFAEVFAAPADRDFTEQVVAAAERESLRPRVQIASEPHEAAGQRLPTRRIAVVVSALAASLIGLVVHFYRGDPEQVGQDGRIAANVDSTSTDRHEDRVDESTTTADDRSPRERVGVTLTPSPELAADASPPASQEVAIPGRSGSLEVAANSPSVDVALPDFNQQLVAYWQAVGAQPAPHAAPEAWSDRVTDRFGVPIEPTSAGGVSSKRVTADRWADRGAAEALAARLVDSLTDGLRPSEEDRARWVASATPVVAQGGRFDHWLADWALGDDGPVASSSLPADHRGEWFATRVVGASVGCARCHDSKIESQFTQADFWAVAAVFSDDPQQPTFYELADGRQRVADPHVPSRWFGQSSETIEEPPVASRDDVKRMLVGNRQVARNLANLIWEIGFGYPMIAPVSSPIAPPQDDSLERALDMLGDHLLASSFDVRAVAAWVASSEPMQRGLPKIFEDGQWQYADETRLAEASFAQRSFAAARVHWPSATRERLVATLDSRENSRPRTLGTQDKMLAQPLIVAPSRIGSLPSGSSPSADAAPVARPADPEDFWWAQWLADREALRGGWLASISDSDQRLRHVFHAAGYREVTPEQVDFARSLLAPADAPAKQRHEALTKAFWVIQNSR